MLFGADRRSAAEFSFWLAMPTMVGAFAYEVFKSRGDLALGGNVTVIAVGFVFSFIFGWIVVKTFLRYVQRHSFALFAWWRILVGGVGLLRCIFCRASVRRRGCGTARSCGSARDKTARSPRLAPARCRGPAASAPRPLRRPTRHCRLRSNSTWSGVSSGFGRYCRNIGLHPGERRTAKAPAAACARLSRARIA